MTEYYRAIFSVKFENIRGLALLEKVMSEARKWAEHEFGESLDGDRGDFEGRNGRLRFGTRPLERYGVSWLVWERPHVGGSEPQWRLSARLATEGDDVEADIEVRGLEVGLEELRAKPPDIVSIFFTAFCCVLDGKRLSATARKIPMEQASSFRDELLDPSRSMPLLVVSEDAMDADYLRRGLLGLVTVVSYDRDTAWEISKNLPRPLRCYDGAIRLYSPNCSESDVSQQHPYWLPGDVDKLGLERMCRILRDECVNRLPRHGRRRLFSRVRDEIRRKEISDLRSQVLDDDDRLSLLTDDLIADDVDSVSVAKYESAITVAKAFKNKADRLALEIEQLTSGGKSVDTESTQVPEKICDDAKPEFANILEVVNWADNGLRFLPSAFESAESVSKSGQFKRMKELRYVFEVMSECAKKRSNGLGKDVEIWFKERGVDYSHREAPETSAKYRRERTFHDSISGKDFYMGEHFKLSDGGFALRIHVRWHKTENRWLVGYVGRSPSSNRAGSSLASRPLPPHEVFLALARGPLFARAVFGLVP